MKIWLIHNPVRLNRIFFVFLSVLLTVVYVYARQENRVICSAVQSQISAKPGTIAAASISVANLSSEQQTFDATIDLPAGWKLIMQEFPYEIKAGDTDVRLITFSIPSSAPAGSFQIRYSVRDHASPVNESAASFEVIIANVIQLDLKILQSPRFVVAGTMFVSTVLVTNKGNSTNLVRLSCQSSQNFPIRLDSTMIDLAPKETRQLQIYVTPDEKSKKINHILEIEAKSRQDTTVRVRISSEVEIIPRAAKLEEDYLIYPVSLRLREVGEDGKFAPQAELYGNGSLKEDKSDRLEFLFRAPETQRKSTLGQRDEYRISYHKDSLELYAGDHTYSLSTLTENGRYAAGIGGSAQIGAISTGGFYNSTRLTTTSQKEIGGFLNYDVAKAATIGVNYLNKREQFSSDIASVEGNFKPFTGTRLNLEYGTGVKNDKRDDAYAALLTGSQRWIAYDLRYVHAGPNFGGYYQDINFISTSVNLLPVKNLRIESYLRLEDRNLTHDTSQIYKPHDVSYQIGAGYSDYFSIYYLNNDQQDQSDSAKYKTREDAIRTRLGYDFSFVNINANIDIGKTRDELRSKESPFKRFALSTSFNLFSKQNYSTSIEYSTSSDPYTGEEQKRISANLGAWILLGESTQAQLNIFGSRIYGSIEQTYSLFEASLEHIFPFNHKIILHGRLTNITPSITSREIAYFVEYAIPIGIPIKRISAVGQLSGSVKDEQGKGLANVMINVNENTALSDKNGAFSFASLKPGSVFLTVDKASIGFEKITIQSVPMELLIEGGKETNVAIQITKSVTIEGQIILFSAKEYGITDTSTTLVDMGGRPGIFLEISNGIEAHRRVSDNKGRFIFTELRPGQWIFKVVGGDIPEYYNIIPETMKIELSPGEKKEITIQLKPRRRTIKMLEGSQPTLQVTPKNEGNLSRLQIPSSSEKKDTVFSKPQTSKPCMITFNEQRKGYVLQVASSITKKKADSIAKKASKITGLKTFRETAMVPSIGRRYRVFIVGFKTREEAVAFCQYFNFDL